MSDRKPSTRRARRVLLVLGHGRPDSLCHRLMRAVRETLVDRGAEVRTQDLLADGFDPVLRLPRDVRHALPEHTSPLARRYHEDVKWMDALVVVHPVWWFAPPAILKGWVDQVLVHGVAIEQQEEGNPRPLLRGRRALVIQTYNASRSVDRLVMRGLSESFWRRAVFLSVGILRVRRIAFYGVDTLSPRRLATLESRVRKAAEKLS
jgi:NAD(P)H dehydrogenase (quinone)